jgi:hypothetical protein
MAGRAVSVENLCLLARVVIGYQLPASDRAAAMQETAARIGDSHNQEGG